MVASSAIINTSYSKLLDADLIGAVYYMFNASLWGFFIIGLFMVFQFMLFLKTRSPGLCFVAAAIFTGTVAFTGIIPSSMMWIVYIIDALTLGLALMYMYFENK